MRTKFCFANLKGRGHLKDLSVEECFNISQRNGMDWTNLGQDSEKCGGFCEPSGSTKRVGSLKST